MKGIIGAVILTIQLVLADKVTLRIPTRERDLVGIRMTVDGDPNGMEYTEVYVGEEGNLINEVWYYNNLVFYSEEDLPEAIRRVYLEVYIDVKVLVVETLSEFDRDAKYYHLERNEVSRINFWQFLRHLRRPTRRHGSGKH